MNPRVYSLLLLVALLAGLGLTRWIVSAQAEADQAAGQASVASLQVRIATLDEIVVARDAEIARLSAAVRDARAETVGTAWSLDYQLDAQTTRLLAALRREWGACLP